MYKIAGKFSNDSIISKEAILKLRAGGIKGWVAAFGIIIAIITLLNNVHGFQVPPGVIFPPHLTWLYENQQPHH